MMRLDLLGAPALEADGATHALPLERRHQLVAYLAAARHRRCAKAALPRGPACAHAPGAQWERIARAVEPILAHAAA